MVFGHPLKAPRPYHYESGIYFIISFLRLADNLTTLYPNTDTNIELTTALLHPKALRTQFPANKKTVT